MSGEANPFAAFAGLTLSHLEDTLGVIFIAYSFASVGFGFTFFQSYFYYTRYPSDSWLVQAAVVAVGALDTAMSALASHALYYYLVTLFALPVGPDAATRTFCIEVILSGLAVAIVQGYYAVRIWQVSQTVVLPALIVVLAVAGGALGIASGAVMLHNTLFVNFAQDYMKGVIAAGHGIRLLSMLLSTGGYIMFGVKTGSHNDKASAWDPFTNFLTSGMAGALAQLLCFVTFIAMPRRYIWIIFHYLSSRVIINGWLLMLNCRVVSHGRGVNEEDTRFISSRGITPTLPTKSTASDIMFHTHSNRNPNHTVNIEVSRVINTDMEPSKYDDFDSTYGTHKLDHAL
ncbi:hypothetical protein R3P38DRAFT_2929864 [Favolaschia claudopus]|uniref:Uncharacterized protein n=1 Tax=Favolaschia claudopus TaxID=2862362 RepID=A0AAW0BV60_9AGAR